MNKNKIFFSVLTTSCVLCFANCDKVNAENFNDIILYNEVKIMDSNVLTNAPEINTQLKENILKLDYSAELINFDKKAINYLVFYEKTSDVDVAELFRVQIKNSGKGTIENQKVLEKIKNNTAIFVRVESFHIENNKVIDYKYSKNSTFYYTPKKFTLEIIADKSVYENNEQINVVNTADGIIDLPVINLRKYKTNKYYSYENSKIYVDNEEVSYTNAVKIPYFANNIKIELAKNEGNWAKINVEYPTYLKENNVVLYGKEDIDFKDFLIENKEQFSTEYNVDNYIFVGYYIDDENIVSYTNKIREDLTIKAKFNTKINFEVDDVRESFYVLTGDKITSKLDLEKYRKENYDIKDYTLINNNTKEEKIVEDISNLTADESVTIKPNYVPQEVVVKVRQDDYNSRFGTIDASIKNLDVNWDKNKPLEELLAELKSKIQANKGYTVQFRINKKVLTGEEKLTEDVYLEIYFKKNETDWVTVKFTGEGVDKFLSDGQELLAGDYLDTINLPTSYLNDKRFIGWEASKDYVMDNNGKQETYSTSRLLKPSELSKVVTEQDKNLIFTAVYAKNYDVTIENIETGSVIVTSASDNIFQVEQDLKIENYFKNNKLLVLPKSHYKFSHFVSTLPVLVNKGNGNMKIIPYGSKITLSDFYDIVVEKNLTLYPVFVFHNGVSDYEHVLLSDESSGLLDFNFENNLDMRIDNALGPLYFLR